MVDQPEQSELSQGASSEKKSTKMFGGLPVRTERDGVQEDTRLPAFYEIRLAKHQGLEAIPVWDTEDPLGDEPSRLTFLTHIEWEKDEAEKAIAKILGGYKGLTQTFIKPRKKRPVSRSREDPHPDAYLWEYDKNRTLSEVPGKSGRLARRDTLYFAHRTGQINPLTELGHAVGVVVAIEEFLRSASLLSNEGAFFRGMEVGKSLAALSYKPHEAIAAGQARAKKAGRTRPKAHPDRTRYILEKDAELRAKFPKKQSRYHKINEMLVQDGRWKVLSPSGIESLMRRIAKGA